MDDNPRQTADQCAVDADELQVAADGIFDAVGDGGCVPAGDGVGDKPDDIVAVIFGRADNGAAGEAVDLVFQPRVFLQIAAKFDERIAKAAGQCGIGVTRCL